MAITPSPERHARQANEIPQALKARNSKAQGEGREAAEALGWSDLGKALKGRRRLLVSPFQGFVPIAYTQGSGRCAAFTLGFAATRLQRYP